jgi:branched-chain amino acid transport system substrate-binding protein
VLFWLAGLCTALAEGNPILVGAVVSQTGAHAEVAGDYAKGIELWRDEVNAAGGLLGRHVELRLLDDASQAVRTREMYVRLMGEEKADLLMGPYGSAATLVAGAETERARRVMINGAGPASAVHGRSPKYLFQSGVPYAAYGEGVLQIAAEAGYRKLFILARDDTASREMAQATHTAAAAQEFAVSDIVLYKPGTLDFAAQVAKARALEAQAWITFGDVRDAAEIVKTFKRLKYAPQLFFARAASHPRFIALLGQDAEFSLGAVDFDPRLGVAAGAFAKAYMAKWTVPPSLAAAEGYAAGAVLAAGVRQAGTLDQEKLRAALASLEVSTLFGEYKVAPENGVQIGAKPTVVQIRKGRPEPGTPLLPYPQWDERTLIR